MSVQAIENLLYQAEKLPVDERLLLIERLVESVRRIHVETASQAEPEEPQTASKWAKLARRVRENPIAFGDGRSFDFHVGRHVAGTRRRAAGDAKRTFAHDLAGGQGIDGDGPRSDAT